jgi:phage-related protein
MRIQNKERKESNPPESTFRGTLNPDLLRRVPVLFYRTDAGNEPVRVWLRAMKSPEDRRLIGEDIKTVEFGWPIGMPTRRPLGGGLHEVRTNLPGNRIPRVFFCVDKRERMVLLHGILKKTQATPASDLALARAHKLKHEKEIP